MNGYKEIINRIAIGVHLSNGFGGSDTSILTLKTLIIVNIGAVVFAESSVFNKRQGTSNLNRHLLDHHPNRSTVARQPPQQQEIKEWEETIETSQNLSLPPSPGF